jgi:hypothetical protein
MDILEQIRKLLKQGNSENKKKEEGLFCEERCVVCGWGTVDRCGGDGDEKEQFGL